MVNYPNGNNKFSQKITYSNRGMHLEDDINFANKFYLKNDTAVIHKKPIPIQIVKVDYPSRNNAMIKKAFYKVPSTTDYNGIYKGKYIDFEAKETNSTTSFSLNNIHKHQIEHMASITRHGGIAFIIVRFKKINRTFIMPFKKLINFYERSIKGGRKSIKLSEFVENSFELDFNYKIRLDYIKIIKDYESEFM
ncbi:MULTISPECIES: Holliday junction resolvase RecU [unclassified Gemella]|uniref:Holliday junction resolvase RecU n=1 Tax=unclassified Gemella TaxID=2624949 RepID=UPI001C0447F3|nr:MULTISPECIES: Holliday junction resolvase RecU [unclassified Gemella]MBU0278646.1 Holliday junction resolvase RecU [Gemella sp. zg-1178]QWQ39202.1 Holliday junction resolvase RecU [Gemella sp. zg-570]